MKFWTIFEDLEILITTHVLYDVVVQGCIQGARIQDKRQDSATQVIPLAFHFLECHSICLVGE